MKDGCLLPTDLFALPALVVRPGLFWLWKANVVPVVVTVALLALALAEPIGGEVIP